VTVESEYIILIGEKILNDLKFIG